MICMTFLYLGDDEEEAKWAKENLDDHWIYFDVIYLWKNVFIGYTSPPSGNGRKIEIKNFYDYRACFRGGE